MIDRFTAHLTPAPQPAPAPEPAAPAPEAAAIPATDPAAQVHLIDPADIDENALPRDRTTLDPAALAELEMSILLTGLRQPIEVWAFVTPRESGQRYGLISGMRRLTAFRTVFAGKPDRIPAFIRQPTDIADAMAKMVAENEIRAEISPWEKGRLVVQAWADEMFDTLDAAVAGLYPTLDRFRRMRIRAIAEVVHEIDEALLAHPETLSGKQLTRIAAAIRQGYGDVISKALQTSKDRSPEGQWTIIRAILDEADGETRSPRTGYRPGRPRRMVQARVNLHIRREKTPEGWNLRFTGPDATGPLMEDIMDYVEQNFGC
jgi:ParB family transcriptional regulator, chromosome partitioning protein